MRECGNCGKACDTLCTIKLYATGGRVYFCDEVCMRIYVSEWARERYKEERDDFVLGGFERE